MDDDLTLARILKALKKRPSLLLAVKKAIMDLPVAGAWESFNDSVYSKTHNIGYPSGTTARFMPDTRGSVEEVVKVYRRIKQGEPDWTSYVYDWSDVDPEDEESSPPYDEEEFQKDHDAWVAEVADMKERPWQFVISGRAHCISPIEGDNQGFAGSFHEAQTLADITLTNRGWVLDDTEDA